MEIVRKSLNELAVDPDNARAHSPRNLDAVKASLAKFGQQEPLVVNADGKVIGGNCRLEAMQKLGWTDAECVVFTGTPAQERALGLALNRTAELADWDMPNLEAALASLDQDLQQAAGFTADEMAEMFGELQQPQTEDDAEPQVDRAAELNKEWQVKPGDLWLLGDHRLLCGDSTKAEDVERLMAGAKADLCFTSPPYGQQRDYTKEGKAKVSDWDGLMRGVFANLPMADAGQVLVNLGMIHRDGEWIPYWDGWISWMREQGWRRFGWYVWDQGPGMPGDWNGRLAPSHEFIWHFNRESVRPQKARDCKHAGEKHGGKGQRGKDGVVRARHSGTAPVQSHAIHDSVFRVNRQGAMHGADGHPAPYPVGLPFIAMQSWPGVAYEPFCGSGTTMVAAQNLGRKCYGMEISPDYCAVILQRMTDAFSGIDIRRQD